jgi:hypothetical protein
MQKIFKKIFSQNVLTSGAGYAIIKDWGDPGPHNYS